MSVAVRTRPTWKQLCAAGRHRFRGKEHSYGCPEDIEPHMHVTCRRCHWWWLEMMLFDPRPWDAA